MAASGVGVGKRFCRRYRFFFGVTLLFFFMQCFLAYNFYVMTQDDELLKRRLKELENKHQLGEVSHHNHTVQPLSLKENGKKELIIGGQQNKDDIGVAVHKNKRGKNHPNEIPVKFQPKCFLEAKETLSAIERARTSQCKQSLADVACDNLANKLFPTKLVSTCPLKDKIMGTRVGCYRDDREQRLLVDSHADLKETNTPDKCISQCYRGGYKLAGVQYGYECWCGNTDMSSITHKILSNSSCNSKCPGDPEKTCGGFLAVELFHTGVNERRDNPAELVLNEEALEQEEKIRVVYALTVSGRAVRQVHRLFKTLYHPDHYYYIHVDARQEYMHRELSKLAMRFPNVRMSKRRLSTIWGGASLLSMLLNCIKELVEMTDWNWDIFINLSESDFPVKTTDELVAFLTKYKDNNFVKSHGRDTPRFIRKQGLDKLFHECDTHMWRLGDRVIPEGVRIDGGSDWIALNREFSHYLSITNDSIVTGLREYWKYSLLPAESFFHTVLHNTRFCTSVVNNNLHLTNWRRKQGCKCQYKHIVDWCGCSPNDFMPSDMDKLLGTEGRTIFFARKFEAIINQEIINLMDVYLYGNVAEDLPGLYSYWQNDYHYLDEEAKVDDAYYTMYTVFTQLSLQQLKTKYTDICAFEVTRINEVHTFNHNDAYQGLLVTYNARTVAEGYHANLQTFVQAKKIFKIIKRVGPTSRLKDAEVGTSFDPKEEIFRNFGGLIGPFSDIVLLHRWTIGQEFTLTIVYLDPALTIVASFDVIIKADETVNTHKPDFTRPLRPGMWTVRFFYLWESVAETQFLVTPLLFYNGEQTPDNLVSRIHSGPDGLYTDKDFNSFKQVLHLTDTQAQMKLAAENALRTGQELTDWVMSLAEGIWTVSDTCFIGDSVPIGCPGIKPCQKSTWSSFSPDPKSEMGDINLQTGRLR